MSMLELTPDLFKELRRLGDEIDKAVRSQLFGADGEVKSPLHLLIGISALSFVTKKCVESLLDMTDNANVPAWLKRDLRAYYEDVATRAEAVSIRSVDDVGEIAKAIKPVEASAVGALNVIIAAVNDE